jgi:hypothetical protein
VVWKQNFVVKQNEKRNVFVRHKKEIVSPILKKLNQTNEYFFLSEHSDAFFVISILHIFTMAGEILNENRIPENNITSNRSIKRDCRTHFQVSLILWVRMRSVILSRCEKGHGSARFLLLSYSSPSSLIDGLLLTGHLTP